MKGRVGVGSGAKGGGAPPDLLVCFPSRAHLTLMPKPICSPSRPAEQGKRHPSKSGSSRGQASPLFKTKSKHMSSDISEEPTSPKVTCSGQIKVRPKPRPRPGSSKDWLSVVEQFERLQQQRKRPHWLDALGIKKDIMQFLGALRSLRFDMRCFGSFHGAVDDEDDEEDDEDEEGDEEEEKESQSSASKTIFSKWFMVLEENQTHGGEEKKEEEEEEEEEEEAEEEGEEVAAVPPANALLLMRCRSAPAKGWSEGEGEEGEIGEEMSKQMLKEEEKEKERLILMSYAPDFFKVSTEIAKETWVVAGGLDPLGRSRSWRR